MTKPDTEAFDIKTMLDRRYERRKFLKALSAGLGTVGFGAFGTVNAATCPVTISDAGQFLLTSPIAGTAPFAIGYAFKQGDIPNGMSVTTSLPNSQATIKNTWPDGSAKFAIIAGRAELSAGVPTTVYLLATTATAGGATLTTANLRNTGIVASISCASFGSASWTGADWDVPFQTWVSGSEISSWLYRKPVGSDPHLVAWLEVRLFADGNVEVLPWIENGYLLVAGPTNKNVVYTFTLGSAQRFSAAIDLKAHQRTPLLSGTALSHWLGVDPNVTVKHDAAYLQATRMVPTYSAVTPGNAPAVLNLPASYTPLQRGSYPAGIGAPGYDPSIGILPEWDVLYLTCNASDVSRALQRNAYSAGRYGIHFRDEKTNRPIRFSQYPTLVLDGSSGIPSTGASTTNSYTPAQTGGAAQNYTNTHGPQLGYMAYLITGRYYHLETAQFQATCHFLKNSDIPRQKTAGVFRSDAGANTTRGSAWAIRSLSMATAITPNGDPLQAELLASIEANINFYHGTYVAQANNPWGWVKPYSDYTVGGDNVYFEATWMQDFFTAACGYMKAAGLPISSATRTKLDAFFAWKAKSIVGRFGGTGATEYLYRDAAPYTIAVAPSDTADWDTGIGPWFANMGALYNATWNTPGSENTNPGPRAEGGLRGGHFPDPTSYWGNLQPALAYAVEHGVPGAALAYARMTSASNWADIANGFNTDPVWSVRPAFGQ